MRHVLFFPPRVIITESHMSELGVNILSIQLWKRVDVNVIFSAAMGVRAFLRIA